MLYKFNNISEEAESRKKLFVAWMMFERDIKASTASDHAMRLDSRWIREALQKRGMRESIFSYENPLDCMSIFDELPKYLYEDKYDKYSWRDSFEMHIKRTQKAFDLYIEWLRCSEVFTVGDFRGMIGKNERLSGELEESLQKIKELATRLEGKDAELRRTNRQLKDTEDRLEFLKANPPKPDIDHEKLVAEIFCEIAQRYMECTRYKSETQRTKIKESLQSIMNELKMHVFIPQDLQKSINHFDDQQAQPTPSYYVNGDLVLEKNVEHEVGYVAKGGTGIRTSK